VKVSPVDPEIVLLNLKKKEITKVKIYIVVGRFAERAKKVKEAKQNCVFSGQTYHAEWWV